MKKYMLVAVLAALTATNAMAHVASGSNGDATAATGSPLHSATPTAASGTSAIYKQAIVAGQEAAVNVLNGGEATDLFIDAKAAAEEMLQTKFDSDEDAAAMIISLAEQFNK